MEIIKEFDYGTIFVGHLFTGALPVTPAPKRKTATETTTVTDSNTTTTTPKPTTTTTTTALTKHITKTPQAHVSATKSSKVTNKSLNAPATLFFVVEPTHTTTTLPHKEGISVNISSTVQTMKENDTTTDHIISLDNTTVSHVEPKKHHQGKL